MRLHEIAGRITRNPLKTPSSVPSQRHLYHGTELHLLASIVKNDALYQGGHWGKPNEPHGVRCTRSMAVARTFALEQENPGGILMLDWPKLSTRYQTIPYADVQADGDRWPTDEQEEVILARVVKPLRPFLDAILMPPDVLAELRSGAFLTSEALAGYTLWDGRPAHVHRRNIEALMAFPALRPLA